MTKALETPKPKKVRQAVDHSRNHEAKTRSTAPVGGAGRVVPLSQERSEWQRGSGGAPTCPGCGRRRGPGTASEVPKRMRQHQKGSALHGIGGGLVYVSWDGRRGVWGLVCTGSLLESASAKPQVPEIMLQVLSTHY